MAYDGLGRRLPARGWWWWRRSQAAEAESGELGQWRMNLGLQRQHCGMEPKESCLGLLDDYRDGMTPLPFERKIKLLTILKSVESEASQRLLHGRYCSHKQL
jgi:hypothetical protein